MKEKTFALILFLVCGSWIMDSVATSSYILGTDVKLKCSNKTWNEIIYVIWNIDLKYKQCKISVETDGRSQDTCNDSKSIRNSSRAELDLHIPNFSNDDVGVYKCESAHKGGDTIRTFNVAAMVPPTLSAWLEWKDDKMMAVCKAEGGKPAAEIAWSSTRHSSFTKISSGGLFTVERTLDVPEDANTENLTCIIRHPYWESQKILVPKLQEEFPFILVVVPTVVIVVAFFTGFLLFTHKRKRILSCCQKSDLTASKYSATEEVEEVEPYASYVQRVNSIYNS